MKKIIVHMASYGSGKTEFALNEARALRAAGNRVVLVDMDIVNPYFRSGEHAQALAAEGIELIMPTFANTAVDVPALPAAVQTIFDREDICAILDAGGDPVGATALGRYSQQLIASGAHVRYIINIFRPFTQTPEQIKTMAQQLVQRSHLPINALVNNTHMANFSTPEMLLEGYELLSQVGEELGIPVECSLATEEIAHAARTLGVPDVREIALYTRPEWL